MWKLSNILVVIDLDKDHQVALNRATQIAKATQAALHVVTPLPKADKPDWDIPGIILNQLKQQGIEAQLHKTQQQYLIDTVLRLSQAEGCQLIIKDAKLMGFLAQTFGSSSDWSLLRRSEVPVLLVKHDQPWHKAAMMAAINADKDCFQHTQLNHAILNHAAAIAAFFSAELHLASIYSKSRLPMQDHGDGVTQALSYEHICKQLANEHAINEQHIHIQAGDPEALISQLVYEEQAQLLIVGTHARSGISALAIGNTSEQLIASANADLLVVQPEHHMPPLEAVLQK